MSGMFNVVEPYVTATILGSKESRDHISHFWSHLSPLPWYRPTSALKSIPRHIFCPFEKKRHFAGEPRGNAREKGLAL